MFLLVLFILNSSTWATENRAPVNLLANTKEAYSQYLSRKDLRQTRTLFEDASQNPHFRQVFEVWAQEMESKSLCESDQLDSLSRLLGLQGLPNDETSVRRSLLVFRRLDWIDDVFLGPILAFFPAWANMHGTEISKNRGGFCISNEIFRIYGAARAKYGRKTNLSKVMAEIEKSPDDREWLTALANAGYYLNTSRTLSDVYKSLAAAKDHFSATPSTEQSFHSEYLTARRIQLYQKYNGLQINLLAKHYAQFTQRMTADSVELKIYYKDKTQETYELDPQEQYYLAIKMLNKEILELRNSKLFDGNVPDLADTLTASIETGLISSKDAETVVKTAMELDPKISKWEKAFKIINRFGVPALVLIPPPGNIIAGLVVAVVEIVEQSRHKKPTAPRAGLF